MVSAAAPRRRVLIIDDDEVGARAIQRVLRGDEVRVASSVATAVELAPGYRPELVLVDFYLPDGTGRDVIAQLRELGVDAPVLLMSASLKVAEWCDWGAYLADDFIAKPFLPEQLVRKVDRLWTGYELKVRTARQHTELVALHDRHERESDAARRVLDRMFQRGQFDPRHVRFESLTAGTFGGDVVFGHEFPDGRYRWLVGDATGHTLASALVTIPISMIFYNSAERGFPLAEVFELSDRELHAMLPVTMFFAAAFCELDRARGELTIFNAGCPDVLILRASAAIEAVASDMPPLGIAPSPPLARVVAVRPGDRIYAMTDGLLEVRDPDGAMFGNAGVHDALRSAAPEHAFDALLAAWRTHAETDLLLEDDISFIEVTV